MLKTKLDNAELAEFLDWERKEHNASFKLQSFEIVAPYTLHLKFTDCEKIIDFRPFLFHPKAKQAYAPLKDVDYFNQLRLELNHLTWPDGTDFNPAMIYYWDELAASKWIEG